MMRSKLFLIFVLCFAAGVFAAPQASHAGGQASLYYTSLFFILLGLFLCLPKLLKFDFDSLLLGMILVSFGLGLFYYGFKAVSLTDVLGFENQVGQRVVVEGVIVDEPDERENYTKLVLETGNDVNILVTAHHYPRFQYGDEVEMIGVLKKPKKFQSFDWPAYLAKDDIFFEMFYPEVKFISSGNASQIKQSLFSLKEKLLLNVFHVIPEPHSALLGGLTFGAKRSMPPDLLEDFRKTGIVHIVVLSGYNVTVVADAIMRTLSFLPAFFGITFGIMGIVGFAIMAGASATIVRASIMAIMVLLARATGRIYQVTVALFAAGFFMILHNPKVVRFDSSFQLSFLATLALIYLAPILEPHLRFFPKKWQIRELAAATLATQIFVLPLLLYKMGLFSVVSLPVNLLILIFVPATMFFGFVTAVVGFLSTFLSMPFAWATYGLLTYQLKVVELFSSLPFASFTMDNFPLWLMLSVYVGYAGLIWYYKNRQAKKMRVP